MICDATGDPATSAYAPCDGGISEHIYAFVPLEAIPWARQAGVALPPISPYTTVAYSGADGHLSAQGSEPLKLVSPSDGQVLHLSRELRLQDQKLRIEALSATSVVYVEVYVDGALIRRIEATPYRANWQLAPGTHAIRARAVDAAGNETWSDETTITVLPP
jgi:hypothetical protein